MNRASARITRTPMAVKRSAESFGAIAAMTPRTWSRTRGEIDLRIAAPDAEAPGVADAPCALVGRGDQRLRGHAADIEAVAAHAAALDQHHRHAEATPRWPRPTGRPSRRR